VVQASCLHLKLLKSRLEACTTQGPNPMSRGVAILAMLQMDS